VSDDALSPLATARTQVSTEWEELQTERAAFEAFADRVEALDFARGGGPQRRGAVRTLTASATRESPSKAVRRAFRETVMAVDHYDSAYGESFEEHLRSELGPDVATALVADEPLFPGFGRVLLRATAGAIADRRSFGEHVEAEWRSLTDATTRLEATVTDGRRSVTHADAVDYLNRLAQPWREDASNADVSRTRARLRRDVLPVLRELRPGAALKAAELADHAREAVRRLPPAPTAPPAPPPPPGDR